MLEWLVIVAEKENRKKMDKTWHRYVTFLVRDEKMSEKNVKKRNKITCVYTYLERTNI